MVRRTRCAVEVRSTRWKYCVQSDGVHDIKIVLMLSSFIQGEYRHIVIIWTMRLILGLSFELNYSVFAFGLDRYETFKPDPPKSKGPRL